MSSGRILICTLTLGSLTALSWDVRAQSACEGLPSFNTLKNALQDVVEGNSNSGLGNDMWVTVVNRDGVVCNVAFTGDDRDDQWPGSRVISAQKANTANAFSRPRNV